MKQQRTVILAYEGVQLLDVAGPGDVFDAASQVLGHAAYTVEVVAPVGGLVRAGNGMTLGATAVADVAGASIDTLIVAGGWPPIRAPLDEGLVQAVADLAAGAERIASVCTGAFLLAATGLLADRRATTHWLVAERLARAHPEVTVEPDAIYVRDGNVWTSAGVTAGIDLALAMVATDHGHDVARRVASGLVVYLQRPGGQSQFSTPVRAEPTALERLQELQAYIDAHPAADLSVPALAARAGMSPRHFARVFTDEIGVSPGRYVEQSRADAARRLLETTDATHERVARESGLGSAETLYRVFRRRWHIAPGDYRRRFRTSLPERS